MAKITEKYEAIIVFSLKKDEEQIKALTAKFADLIKENGTLGDIDEWARRSSHTRSTMSPKVTTFCTTSSPSLISPLSLSVLSTSLTAFCVPS